MAEGELRFSLLSRGDRVRGRLLVPTGPPPHPVVLFLPPDGCAFGPQVDRVAPCFAAWAIASIDLPLCGARHSDKLSAVVFDPAHPLRRALRGDLETQLAADLERTLAWLAEGERARAVALVAVGPAADLARPFSEGPGRLDASVLAPDAELSPSWLQGVDRELRSRLRLR